ncbi:hypothetical protein H5407_21305 [Mitsuaria sp. WAJ17]|uniref:hypothetical protein n=1 Tax=Mitsuaria sp. WAJ17 TaxID=2761452 RepID=UPI001604892F|nr:hypothetical protein [Mitsuaria sp. WAJ17]MBB2487782.1 hypothetical protein [Mitsuaria sp. WAJ17]
MMERLLERLELLGRMLQPRACARPLEILQSDEWRLVIQGGHSQLCFDRRRQAVTNAGRVVVAFESIVQVVVRHHRGSDDAPERWSVALQVNGWFADISVGSSADDVDASIAAARIATHVGRPVKAG